MKHTHTQIHTTLHVLLYAEIFEHCVHSMIITPRFLRHQTHTHKLQSATPTHTQTFQNKCKISKANVIDVHIS